MAAKATSAQRTAAQTTTGQRATTPGLCRNLTNLKGTCYVSTVAQVLHGIPHVRTFVKSPINFRFVQKEDSRGLVEALRDIFQKLDEGGRKLPPAVTENLLGKISSLGNDYGTEAHDAKELFEQLLDMLVGTSSVTSAGGESARPLEQLAAELECTQRPLKDDAKRSWSGFTHNGRETLLAEMLYHQIVRERVCTSCGFIDRLFQQLATVTIESPDGILSPAGKRYDLKELFRDYVLDTAAEEVTDRVSRCPVTTCKSALGPQTRRIVKTPQVLSFTFRRALQDFSGQEQKWLNHVEVPERLNLAEYVDDISLPSERKQSVPGSTPMRWVTDEMTDYVLQATIHYRPTGAHYVPYVRHDDKWIRFDDIEETPDECSPWDGIRETPDEAVYVAVYLKSQPPPPLQAPAQTGEKHPRPGTSGSTAAERNQRQGFPPTGTPLISNSRPEATTPVEQPQHTKTKAKESSDNTLLRRFKAQIGPMLPGADLDKRMKQLAQQLQTQQNDFVAEIKEHIARLSQQPATVNSEDLAREIKKYLMQAPQQLPVRTDQDLGRILKQVQGDVADIKKQISTLQTKSSRPQNESSQFGQLKEAIARIEKHLLQSANAREDERRARQEIAAEEAQIAAEEARIAAEEAQIADIEVELANRRKRVQKAKAALGES
ncbi:Ubiquitin carboxyl-terminal hydrolase 11 [Lasiodiplodia theobromae]|uniref:ubiquitinyl hydrolase 1 n=1 Tax=Lasiodiplodia theobromae TaxID=45133 RepID=A0A5N5D969_9PEZI|nr:Ubiquitin carboxyl-terminal hydrolase 11 [Lasiodiplodia theobromae]